MTFGFKPDFHVPYVFIVGETGKRLSLGLMDDI